MSKTATPIRWSRARIVWLTALVALAATGATATYLLRTKAPTWPIVNGWIATRYADVDGISTNALASLIASDTSPTQRPLLLDIREAREYAVSRIPGAKHVAPSSVIDTGEREFATLPRATPIVVYCAVGVRSAQAAQELKMLGFTHVHNLQGSIFQWANEGRALEGGTLVHPYDAQWGQLLREDLHAIDALQ
jgi:rhodanese-related sulfurtransferase